MQVLKASLPNVEAGGLAVVKGLVPPEDCTLAVQDLTGMTGRLERTPLTFDQVWHSRVPEHQRPDGIAQLLGNSRSFVEAQSARLALADELRPLLESNKPNWRKMTGVVKVLTSDQGKPVGVDGVRDLRIAIITGPMTLEIGKNKDPAFEGLQLPLKAGDGVVVNNDPGERQTEYGMDIFPDSAPQAVLYFCMTD